MDQAQQTVGAVAHRAAAKPAEVVEVRLAAQHGSGVQGVLLVEDRARADLDSLRRAQRLAQMGDLDRRMAEDVEALEPAVPRQRPIELQVGDVLAERIGSVAQRAGRMIDAQP